MFEYFRKLFGGCDHDFRPFLDGSHVWPDWSVTNYSECLHCRERVSQKEGSSGGFHQRKGSTD